LGKVRFSGYSTNLEQKAVSEILGYRSEITIELYAPKGMGQILQIHQKS
jgi:hypothetical protein